MYSLIRRAIFSLEPETAHDLAIQALHWAGQKPFYPLFKALLNAPNGQPKTVMGIEFKTLLD
ncbi:dihydroorotate dehydrogenase 2 domain protein [Haemophilus pittmaniae HK 85]|uniref:Dihydroorotate dehydrogenase 2 domain protein n=1 Tax=Haemophilus pittmaniae HK 85 TaxID=1035188 RepID=F9QAP5_9PAST|nr:dihydroorotate dehydrogenase 2 domain protein [Haemophilus pittmaniae HK 85]